MPASCAEVYKWKINRLNYESTYGSEKESNLAKLSLLMLQRYKSQFMKSCKKDPALPFYINEEDYNTKQDKIDKLMKKVNANTTHEHLYKIQEKINKILLK
jgi:hypothetical protein